MPSVSNNPTAEDRYIAHMAGISNKPIEFVDQPTISAARKYPTYNKLASTILGSMQSQLLTNLGILAYPLANSSMRSSILGSAWNVCSSCGANVKNITNLAFNILKIAQPFMRPSLTIPTYWEQTAISYSAWGAAITGCAVEDSALLACRGVNYVSSVLETFSNHFILIGAGSIALTSWFASSKMNSYIAKELQAEKEVKQELSDTFRKIAARLEALEANEEFRECAKKILHRRLEINQEIQKLGIPNLTWNDIEQITGPVFTAAEKLCHQV